VAAYATKAGFKSVEIKDVQLLVNNPATINIKFENVGGTSETVTVVATGVSVNTTDATLGNAITGRARRRMQHSYAIRPDADGSFRLEDIPAGTYTLSVMTTSSQQSTSQPGRPPGYERFTREVVVPEMPGGRSDEPLNLGTITLQVPSKK